MAKAACGLARAQRAGATPCRNAPRSFSERAGKIGPIGRVGGQAPLRLGPRMADGRGREMPAPALSRGAARADSSAIRGASTRSVSVFTATARKGAAGTVMAVEKEAHRLHDMILSRDYGLSCHEN